MTLAELIEQYRAEALDVAEPPFATDALLTAFANEAQDEACRRGHIIRDAHSPMSRVAYEADAAFVKLNPRILRVDGAHIDGHSVAVVSDVQMQAMHCGWLTDGATAHRPTHLVEGASTGVLFLWPAPAQAGEIRLRLQRMPRVRLEAPDDEPEIAAHLHMALVQWMLYRAFDRQDSDMYDPARAARALAAFEAEFGQKSSARNEQWVGHGEQLLAPPIC